MTEDRPPAPPLVTAAAEHPGRTAIVDGFGAVSYRALLESSARIAASLLDDRPDLEGARVALRIEPGAPFVAALWGIWRAGGIAVPIATSWPLPEIERLLADADPVLVIGDEKHGAVLERAAASTGVEAAQADELQDSSLRELPPVDASRPALMVYTSGTTGAPKGVVTTHANLVAQVGALLAAWGWRQEDRLLHVLPLHHVHGLINALACPLATGATCEFVAFDPAAVWERFAAGNTSVFMAVPTIYRRLLEEWDAADPRIRERWSAGAAGLRLMVSGSAALPVRTLVQWEEATGHRLLERYGMTEIGMALSNPLEGNRRAGTVGTPLPGVEVRLVDESGERVADGADGEIEVRGPQVFREYWRRSEETAAAFRDGWFRTGDVARIDDGHWRLLGRSSIDIVKTGGYKVSALEVEETLREHPEVADVAAVGIPDDDWGERLCAVLVTVPGVDVEPAAIRLWCKERLAPYKVPRTFVIVDDLPRNAMGKVLKPALRDRLSETSKRD